jgi:hypothetical protein
MKALATSAQTTMFTLMEASSAKASKDILRMATSPQAVVELAISESLPA